MDKIKYALILILFSVMIFGYSINEGEEFIRDKKYDAAFNYFTDYFSNYDKIKEKNLKSRDLITFYLALSLYKMERYEDAYSLLSEIMEDNKNKIGYNLLMGLLIIKLGEEDQGMKYLKQASLLEGIKLKNSLDIIDGKYKLKRRTRFIIRNINRIDPEGVITYDYYHNLLFNYFKRIGKLTSLGVEYEKLILKTMSDTKNEEELYKKNKDLFKELANCYVKAKYYDSLSFVLDVYLKNYKSFASKAEVLNYIIFSASVNLKAGNYIECQKKLLRITNKELKILSKSDLIEYYRISMELYYVLNISEKLGDLLDEFLKSKIKKVPIDDIKNFTDYAISINDLDVAYKLIKLFMKESPNDFRGYLLLANYYLKKGNYRSAMTLLQEIKNTPSDNYLAHSEYGKFIFNVALSKYLNNEDYKKELDEAIVEEELALEFMPEDFSGRFDIYKILGKVYYLKALSIGQIGEMIDIESKLVKRDIYMNKSKTYLKKSRKYLKRDVEILEYKGWTNIFLRHYDSAFEDFVNILKIDPFSNNSKLMLKYIKSAKRSER